MTSQYDYYEFLKKSEGQVFSRNQIAKEFGDSHNCTTIKLSKLCRSGLIDRFPTNKAGSFLYRYKVKEVKKNGIV